MPGESTMHRYASAWVSVAVFGYLAIGTSGGHFWLDSGEIAAAGADLGVVHPPGVAGYVPLLHLCTAMGLGALGWRMSLLSSAFAAWSVGLLVAILRRRQVHWGVWVGAAVLAAAGLTFVRTGRVVEIYGFGAWLAMATLWGFDPRRPREGSVYLPLIGTMAAVVGAIGFGDLRLALAPAVVFFWIRDSRRRAAWAKWAPSAVIMALAVIAVLPLASARGPVADWGDVDDLRRLWSHLSAQTIRTAFAAQVLPLAIGPWLHHLARAGERLGQDLGPVGPAAAAGALLMGLRRRDDALFPILTWVAGIELFYAVGINPMGGVDRQTGLVLALVSVLAIALALHELTRARPKLRWGLLPVTWTALALPAFMFSFGDAKVTRTWAAHAWTRQALAQLEPGSLLLTQQDDLSAGVLAARVLEGGRPDVVSVPGQHLYHPRPDRADFDPRVATLWDAAHARDGEAARILAVLRAWEGPSAVESAGVAVMAPVKWLEPAGSPPVTRLRRRGESVATLPELVESWSGLLETRQDKLRLSTAIGQRISAELALHHYAPDRLHESRQGLQFLLDELLADDARTMISLAAIEDRLGHVDRAIALTRRALELEPHRTRGQANLALYLSRDPNTLGEARNVAGTLTFRHPHVTAGWVRLAEVCRMQRDSDCVARAGRQLARWR